MYQCEQRNPVSQAEPETKATHVELSFMSNNPATLLNSEKKETYRLWPGNNCYFLSICFHVEAGEEFAAIGDFENAVVTTVQAECVIGIADDVSPVVTLNDAEVSFLSSGNVPISISSRGQLVIIFTLDSNISPAMASLLVKRKHAHK